MSRRHLEALVPLRKAIELDRRGKEAEAIPFYKQALSIGLSRAYELDAMFGLAGSLSAIGKHKAAMGILQAVAEKFPNNPVTSLFMALIYYKMNRPGAAIGVIADLCLDRIHDLRLTEYHDVLMQKFRALSD